MYSSLYESLFEVIKKQDLKLFSIKESSQLCDQKHIFVHWMYYIQLFDIKKIYQEKSIIVF